MTTTTVVTVGTGGTYTSPQAAEDAKPANLTTSDIVWQIQQKKQEFVAASGQVLIVSGSITDATRYCEYTTEAGASLFDNAANPLRYDATKGAAMRSTYAGLYGGHSVVTSTEPYLRISRIQIKASASSSPSNYAINMDLPGGVVDSMLFESSSTGATTVALFQDTVVVTNSIAIYTGTNAGAQPMDLAWGASAVNCTLASVGTACNGIGSSGSVHGSATNMAIFGVKATGVLNANLNFTKCYTDLSGTPTGFTTVAYNTTTGSGFLSKTNGTHDLRIGSASALINNGTLTGAPTIDAFGRIRTGNPDVGAFEYVSAGSTRRFNPPMRGNFDRGMSGGFQG